MTQESRKKGVEHFRDIDPFDIDTRIVYYGSEAFEDCLVFEREEFGRFFKLSDEEMDENYTPYNHRSWFVCCYDATGEIIGLARMINPEKGQDCKTFKDLIDETGPWGVDRDVLDMFFESTGIYPDETVDFATYCIVSESTISKDASSMAMASIMAGVFHESLKQGLPNFMAAYDTKPLEFYRKLGLEYQTIAGLPSKDYLGSICEPVCNNFERMSQNLRKSNPALWEAIVQDGWKGQQKRAA